MPLFVVQYPNKTESNEPVLNTIDYLTLITMYFLRRIPSTLTWFSRLSPEGTSHGLRGSRSFQMVSRSYRTSRSKIKLIILIHTLYRRKRKKKKRRTKMQRNECYVRVMKENTSLNESKLNGKKGVEELSLICLSKV